MTLKYAYYKYIRPEIKKIYYFSLGAVLRITSFFLFWIRFKTPVIKQVRKILLIKMERIGDLVLSTPAIRAIRKNFPDCHITIIVNRYTEEIIKQDPNVDDVIVYDIRGLHRSLMQKIGFIKNLRRSGYDLAVDLSTRAFLFTPVWLSYLSRANLTLGLDNFGRGFLFNMKVKPYSEPRSLAEEVLHILSPLGIASSDIQPRLFLSGEDKSYIQELLKKKEVEEDDLLAVVHTGGYYKTQHWTNEGYAEVARHLIRKYKAKVFFVGSHKERELLNKIIALINEESINLIGDETSLGQLMALISRCHLFIGNNSAPLQIAAAFNIPTISFLGPTLPKKWSPQGKRHIVIRKDLPCSPCELGYCYRGDFACMKEITPREVIDAVDRQLKLLF